MGVVTGSSRTRLVELKKYRNTGTLADKYFVSTDPAIDGVNDIVSVENVLIEYYIGGIIYNDIYDGGNYQRTTFSFTASGSTSPDFIDEPILKDFSKGDVIGRPEVKSDVFIIRQSLSIFEDQYRLRAIGNLSQLEFYAGGANFNVINNT